jgi:hypothetical protein
MMYSLATNAEEGNEMQMTNVDAKIADFLHRKDIKFPELGLEEHGDATQTIKFDIPMAA